MFEDEDEEERMEEGDSSQVDTEVDIDVTDIGGEESSSLKRKSPPSANQPAVLTIGSVPETCPEGIFNEDSVSLSKKLKLKVCNWTTLLLSCYEFCLIGRVLY